MYRNTFTIFNKDGTIFGHILNTTAEVVQDFILKINFESGKYHYYVEGYK